MADPLTLLPQGFKLDTAAVPEAAGGGVDPAASLPPGFKIDSTGPGIAAGMTKAFLRGATADLSDKIIAETKAGAEQRPAHNPKLRGIPTDQNEFAQPITDVTAPPTTKEEKKQLVSNYLAQEHTDTDKFAAEHPVLPRIAYGAGMLLTAPFIPVPARAATLTGRIGQGAAVGAGYGGVGGFARSNDEHLGRDVLTGASGGALVGGAVPVVADYAVTPVVDAVARRFGPNATQNQAVREVANTIAKDEAGGGPGVKEIAAKLDASGSPLSIVDVGGKNTQRQLGTVYRQPGPAGQQIAKTLEERDFGAGSRLRDVIAGEDSFTAAQKLIEERAKASAPKYEAAGIPNDPALYPKAPLVTNPQVTRLIEKSKDIQAAISQAKSLPDYADLPANSIVLLDKAYKNIGGMAQSAKQSGNGELARDLNSLRTQLLGAITSKEGGIPAYKEALDAYSGPSHLLEALEEGSRVISKSPAQIAHEISKLSDAEKQFFELGSAGAIRTMVSKTTSTADEAKKIIGSQYLQDQLRSALPKDTADRLIQAAKDEAAMFRTKVSTLGGSQTAERVSSDASQGKSGLLQIGVGAHSLLHGDYPAAAYNILRGARDLSERVRQPSSAVNEEIGKILTTADPETKRKILAQIMASGNQPNIAGRVTAPLAARAGTPAGLAALYGAANLIGSR